MYWLIGKQYGIQIQWLLGDIYLKGHDVPE